MIKNILTVGDSFTYGEELTDTSQAWPYKLGNLCNADVTNLGTPAASNDKIIRLTLDHLCRGRTIDLVVIAWTSPGRTELADDTGYYDIWPGYPGNLFVQDGSIWRQEILEYTNKYHSSKALHLKYIHQIILLQSYFECQNIKYVMMDVLQNEYYKKRNFHGIEQYYHQINIKNFLGFNNSGMIEWAKGCKKGQYGHFLEDGHTIVANKVYEHIRNLSWFS